MKRSRGKQERLLSALAAGVGLTAWVVAARRKRLVLEALGQQVLNQRKQAPAATNDTEETEVPHGQ